MVAAAKYLGVAPWDLAGQPLHWLLVAEASMDADHRAQRAQDRKASRH